MTDFVAAYSRLRIGTAAIEELQAAYDEVGWEVQSSALAKLKHVCLHVNIVSGRLATICERLDHEGKDQDNVDLNKEREMAEKIIADLVCHASQIAAAFGCHISDCIVDRYRNNALRFCPDSVFAKSIPTT